MAKAAQQTPMMEQYWEFRRAIPKDALLLFRLGDFYEMFFEDAKEGARLLGITLTQRQGYPMAGLPYHAAQNYINRLLAAGKKVALCDQAETAQPGKLVKRSLTRILTPGTTIEETQLDAHRNHYLLAIQHDRKGLHAAWLDLSTGDFRLASDPHPLNLLPTLAAIDAREIILPESPPPLWQEAPAHDPVHTSFQHLCSQTSLTHLPGYHFDPNAAARSVPQTLGVLSLDGFGIPRQHPALGPAGALLHYASESLCATPANLSTLRLHQPSQTLLVDPATLRNLEVLRGADHTRKGSLIAAMDATVSPAGARLLEQWLSAPLLDIAEIERRQQCVGAFLEEPGTASRLQEALRQIRDIPRILTRLQNRLRHPRELGGIRDTLEQLPTLASELATLSHPHIAAIAARLHDFTPLRNTLTRALNDELPQAIQDGGCLRDGWDEELDALRSLTRDNRNWLTDFELSEQHSTGIRNLKVRYNGAFGYYIEITKSQLAHVPPHYIRKQTMTHAERYTTEELRRREKEILHAEEKAIAREQHLFADLIATILTQSQQLQETAAALAEIDLFIGWSRLARDWNYCRPELTRQGHLHIEQGRHPVVEQTLRADLLGSSSSRAFVPNDTTLSCESEQIALITGPNMAGKSTYIRQVALITLMAQTGSWVPASRCQIGLVDRIFSRVGASDELARGNSTFMVEMNETANILNNASPQSLIILDEIGRGTSTYDGLSIAWAVIEHLHGTGERGPRTLFATHYHELTQLEKSLPRLRNYCVCVKEWNDEIIFVRQVLPGAADRSYGIQVARLAGLPRSVIARAKTILVELETEGGIIQSHLQATGKSRSGQRQPPPRPQLELF